ncbi:MAG: aldehyde-activating protein [Rhodospirillaceae bacterium]|nr:aldehyde-activating protein [Rhodospirillaceae bacterium]|tara:strand:+ start:3405 stop:3815 length:411 start_codon:yes stop_codon:yes gene_type:complete
MIDVLKGGCQCGTVRFEVSEPATDLYHCHCSMCRKVHGTVFATYAVCPRSGMRFIQGEDNLSAFKSSPDVTRRFCKTCGCQIAIDVAYQPDDIWFMPGILDDADHPGADQTERHIFVADKLPWLHLDEVLPRTDQA